MMFQWLQRLFCFHKDQEFLWNIHGDAIIEKGWKRSVWKCRDCKAVIYKDKLHVDNCGND